MIRMDCLWWTGNNKGKHKVSSGYKIMNMTEPQTSNRTWRQIWKDKIPKSFMLYVTANQEAAVFTHENMRKRSFILVSNCCLCWEAVDTVRHRFLHYKITDHLWKQLNQQLIREKASNIGKSPPSLNKSFSFSLSILSK